MTAVICLFSFVWKEARVGVVLYKMHYIFVFKTTYMYTTL